MITVNQFLSFITHRCRPFSSLPITTSHIIFCNNLTFSFFNLFRLGFGLGMSVGSWVRRSKSECSLNMNIVINITLISYINKHTFRLIRNNKQIGPHFSLLRSKILRNKEK
ncbi:unnamed protein product [Citrullus colocynthis]|uniref:Uncharacterized protein n=1 Tax=Citrullus colocynthis TaxID=252529 RepID=A0ABP0YY11_9ROSI